MDEFKILMDEIGKLNILSASAVDLLPEDLSARTKKKLLKHSPEEAAQILAEAIEEIEHGSIESMDTLVYRKIR